MLVARVGVIVNAQVVDHVVAAVHAVDILDTRLDDMLLLGKGSRPVELDGVLVEIGLAVLVNAAVGHRHIEEVAVERVGPGLVVGCINHVTQRDGLALAAGEALVVDAGVHTVVI